MEDSLNVNEPTTVDQHDSLSSDGHCIPNTTRSVGDDSGAKHARATTPTTSQSNGPGLDFENAGSSSSHPNFDQNSLQNNEDFGYDPGPPPPPSIRLQIQPIRPLVEWIYPDRDMFEAERIPETGVTRENATSNSRSPEDVGVVLAADVVVMDNDVNVITNDTVERRPSQEAVGDMTILDGKIVSGFSSRSKIIGLAALGFILSIVLFLLIFAYNRHVNDHNIDHSSANTKTHEEKWSFEPSTAPSPEGSFPPTSYVTWSQMMFHVEGGLSGKVNGLPTVLSKDRLFFEGEGTLKVYNLLVDNRYWSNEVDFSSYFPEKSLVTLSTSHSGHWLAAADRKHKEKSGLVSVFHYSQKKSDWEQIGGYLWDEESNEMFGTSLSISNDGSALFVGSVMESYVKWFDNVGGDWRLFRTFRGEISSYYGMESSISCDKSLLIITAPLANLGRGVVYMYDLLKKKTQRIRHQSNEKKLGWKMGASYDGSKIMLASNRFDGASAVKLYNRKEDGEYVQVGDTIEISVTVDMISIAISGDGSRIALGTVFQDDGSSFRSQILVYNVHSDRLKLIGDIIRNSQAKALALSPDGKRVAIGAYRKYFEDVPGISSCYAVVFEAVGV